jgi:hypothetical protein
MNRPSGAIPLRPDYSGVRASTAKSFWRGLTAIALATIRKQDPEDVVARAWGRDEVAGLVTRAATSPASSGSPWGLELPISTASLLVTLAPASAAAKLQAAAVPLDFTGVNIIVVPNVTTAPTGTWVAEGSSVKIVQPVYGSQLIGPPKKLLFGAGFTRELQLCTAETGTVIIQRTLSEAAAVALDTALFDNSAADSARPAGLLNGVSDAGAATGGGVAALVADLTTICTAMSTAGISSEDLMLVCNPAQAMVARGLLVGPLSTLTIVGTPAVTAGTIIGIAPHAIAMYTGAMQVEVSTDALVHMATDAHDSIDTDAVSETVKSAYQVDMFVMKLRLRTFWAPLKTGAVQLISAVTW